MDPPSGFESTTPGTILRIRKAPGNLTDIIANSSTAYNILYRTTDSQYKPTWAVATLFLPSVITPNYGEYFLSYQIPYDNANVDGSSSYVIYEPGVTPTDISAGLGRGWHVLTGDYEGPLASFSAGVMSGHAVLDGVRAVLSGSCAETFGLLPEVKYALSGYSGGSIASEFAAELQKDYAPELKFVGVAIGGTVPNITSVRDTVDGTVSAGLLPSWLVGVTSQFPLARKYLVSVLKKTGPYNATTFFSVAASGDIFTDLTVFEFQNISNYFVDGFADLNDPLVQAVVKSDNTMGDHGLPTMPLFVYKAIHDELSPVVDTDELVDRYCELGASIWYRRNTVGTHGSESAAENPIAFEFLESVFAGTYSIDGCKIETVTNPAPSQVVVGI
ncbi:lipase 1 [Mollisia scopiformis]|uniref:Lipase 1 n=1 Tax=Mollisia scopiformis TaxID=149040 RepID=A0A194XTN7_MOLSC|nr:lipase 1 [Mollisia scopiformis]KUJ23062.1 lipase 1 [Mollisia scopiformis]